MVIKKQPNIKKRVQGDYYDYYDYHFHQDEFVGMAITEFMSIRIQIVDTTGDLIRSKHRYPTRCQIQFMMHL